MNPPGPRRIAAYAGLGAPIKALTLTVTLYLPAFYAADGRLGLTTVGLLFLLLRIFDIVIDPVFGSLADRTRSGFGRRRLWIALGLAPLAAAIWMVFHPGQPLSLGMTALWLFLFYLGWTIVTVSHNAWATDITSDGRTQRRLIGWREWAGIAGMFAIMVGPALQERHGVPLTERMGTLGAALAALLLATGLIAVLLVPETPSRRQAPGLRAQFRHLGASAGLRRVLATDLLVGCGYGTSSALMLFVAKSWLGVAGSFSTIMLVYFIGMLASVPFWIRLADRIGAAKTYRLAIGLSAAAQLIVLVLPSGNVLAAGGLWLVQGILTGAYQFSLNTVMAETVERDQERDGDVLSGIYFALLATTNKVGYAVAIGIAYPLLDALGFSTKVTGGAAFPVAAVYAALPALFFASSVWSLRRSKD